jgi:hypothetical protein
MGSAGVLCGGEGHVIISKLAARLARAGITAVLASAVLGWAPNLPTTAARAAALTPASQPAARDTLPLADIQPPGRAWPSFAYDRAQHELVLFGGDNGSTVFGDTWTQKDGTWIRQHPAQSPSPRTGAAMVYDAATRQLLLFGGSRLIGTAGGFYGDTWIWTGCTWRILHPATSPPARHNADMIYDAATRNVVLFGGYDGQYLGDTWTWNGTTWTQQDTPTAPAPRDTGSFAYDSATGTGVLYGGFNGATVFTDTWSWNGTTWTQLTPATSPGPVQAGWQMADDTATGQVLLFGGHLQQSNTNASATWEWNGTTWTQLSPVTSPHGRGHGSMTYNSATQRIVLFGGQGPLENTYPATTWEWNGTTWGSGPPATEPPGRSWNS